MKKIWKECEGYYGKLISGNQKMKVIFLLFAMLFITTAGYAFSAAKHECDYCHTPHDIAGGSVLKAPLSDLCLGCHPDRKSPKEHKVDIVPSMQVRDLPLSKDGKITCITCHDPHGKSGQSKLRRISLSELCLRCHFFDTK